MSIRKIGTRFLLFALLGGVLASCGGVRKNVAYFPPEGAAARLVNPVTALLLTVADDRESAKIYPKQIISHTSYYGEKTFDINNKPVEEVFEEALSVELRNLGVSLIMASDIGIPLDKENKDAVREKAMGKYPEANVAVGLKVLDFMAYSQRNLLTTDVRYIASVELYVLDVGTGELLWADHKTEKTDTVISADRNDMVEELNIVMSDVMKKAVRDNLSLRDLLVKVSSR